MADNGDPAPVPQRTVPRMSAARSFKTTSAVDKMKAYLKEVPVLHAQLRSVIGKLDIQLESVRQTEVEFKDLSKRIEETVARWEEEQKDAGTPGA